MKTYNLEILNKSDLTTDDVNVKDLLSSKAWKIFDEKSCSETIFFRESGLLIKSYGEKTSVGDWDYIKEINKIHIVYKGEQNGLLFQFITFVDGILILQLEESNKVCFLIETNNELSPKIESIQDVIRIIIQKVYINLGDMSFYLDYEGDETLKSIYIPRGIKHIHEEAFKGCTKLSSAYISDSVITIGDYAFFQCEELSSLTIGSEVKEIGKGAFARCSSLKNINVPDSVKTIKDNAFKNCFSLISIFLGKGVSEVGNFLLSNCCGLVNIKISEENDKYDTRENCNAIIETETNTLVCGCAATQIPLSVVSIADYAFCSCKGLTDIVIPRSVKSIGKLAFADCQDLISIFVGSGVVEIGVGLFANSNNLINIKISENNVKYDNREDCNAIVETETNTLVCGCGSTLIPSSIISISDYAFFSCKALRHIIIPRSVVSFGYSAFDECTNLLNVDYLGSIKDWVSIDFSTRESNPIFYSKNLCINGELLKNLVIDDSEAIKDYAFYNCESIKTVVIGNRVLSFGREVFKGCSFETVTWNVINHKDFVASKFTSNEVYSTDSPFWKVNVTNFTIGDKVERIPAYLCYDKKELQVLNVGKNLISVGNYAFYGCINLKMVNYLGLVDKWVSIDFGRYCETNPTFYAKNLYINDELLTDLKIDYADEIKDFAFYNCEGIKTVSIGTRVNRIGKEVFIGCSIESVIWNAKKCEDFLEASYRPFQLCLRGLYYNDSQDYNITSFVFGEEVEHIPAYLCYEMKGLKEINFSENIISIGDWAFFNCKNLTTIEITNNITSIGNDAFYWCDGLESLIIGDCVQYIGNRAFLHCVNLKSLILGKNILSIGEYSFRTCLGLTTVEIPQNVIFIGTGAFADCENLKSIVWHAKRCNDLSCKFDYYSAQCYMSSTITSLIFGEEVEHIPASLCINMVGLEEVIIHNNVISIGEFAFKNCENLKRIDYIGTIDEWVKIEFKNNPIGEAKNLYVKGELLTEVTINTAENIKKYVFSNSENIKLVNIGESVSCIDDLAFYNCKALTDFTVSKQNKFFASENGVLFNKDKTILLKYPEGKKDKSYTIPNSVEFINKEAFSNCDNLMEFKVLSDNKIYSSENGVLFNKDKTALLRYPSGKKDLSYNIPYTVTRIETRLYNKELTSITIGPNVTKINCFLCCFKNLKSIFIRIQNINNCKIDDSAYDLYDTCVLYVPSFKAYLQYKKHPLFSKFKKIEIDKTIYEDEQIIQTNELKEKTYSETYSFKPDKTLIEEYLEKNGVQYFYHFTDKRNLASIKQHGGLYSWSYCKKHNIAIPYAGGDEISRKLDSFHGLEDYVRLSFCDNHPMKHRLYEQGYDLVLLKVNVDVALINETLFSDINATDNNHQRGASLDDLKKVDFKAVNSKYLRSTDELFKKHQAEVLVKTFIPIDKILNIDEFI